MHDQNNGHMHHLPKFGRIKENNNNKSQQGNQPFILICLLASSTALQHAHTSPKDDKADKGERPKHPQDKPPQTNHTFSCATLLFTLQGMFCHYWRSSNPKE
jgi:hypothetical protein